MWPIINQTKGIKFVSKSFLCPLNIANILPRTNLEQYWDSILILLKECWYPMIGIVRIQTQRSGVTIFHSVPVLLLLLLLQCLLLLYYRLYYYLLLALYYCCHYGHCNVYFVTTSATTSSWGSLTNLQVLLLKSNNQV